VSLVLKDFDGYRVALTFLTDQCFSASDNSTRNEFLSALLVSNNVTKVVH
jgi:hypothetical protein